MLDNRPKWMDNYPEEHECFGRLIKKRGSINSRKCDGNLRATTNPNRTYVTTVQANIKKRREVEIRGRCLHSTVYKSL